MIEPNDKKRLEADKDGLATYEFIANHIETCSEDMDYLVKNMIRADLTGQFLISAAHYLHAIDATVFAGAIDALVAAGIDKDRALMEQFYGADYLDRAAELSASDNNFRRIFKRLYPAGVI